MKKEKHIGYNISIRDKLFNAILEKDKTSGTTFAEKLYNGVYITNASYSKETGSNIFVEAPPYMNGFYKYRIKIEALYYAYE
jgi:hypothetical protein